MSNVSLMALPAGEPGATCASCGAALVADQRYCLTCGEPCSPVRLAFLDVLSADASPAAPPPWAGAGALEMTPVGYVPLQPGAGGWLRRYSGLLGLLSLLVLCLLVGLLVGHWVTQGNAKAPATQIVKVEGLGNLASAAPGTSTAPASTAPASERARRVLEGERKGRSRRIQRSGQGNEGRKGAAAETGQSGTRQTEETELDDGQTAPGRSQRARRPADRNGRLARP